MKKNSFLVFSMIVLIALSAISCKSEPEHTHVYGSWIVENEVATRYCACGNTETAPGKAISVSNADGLSDAINDGSKTIYLSDNVEITSTIEVEKGIKLNLNDKNVTGKGTRALQFKAGDSQILGNGKISVTEGIDADSSVIRLGDNSGVQRKISLMIDENVVVSSDVSYGITVFGSTTEAKLEVNGTVNTKIRPAISGNGSSGYKETAIVINGNIVTAEKNAIYNPQAGTLTINGTVTGNGGIEMKSGTLILGKDSVIKATSNSPAYAKNNNDCSTSGYAIAAVDNNSYKAGIKVEIASGTVIGKIDKFVDSVLAEGKISASISLSGGSYSEEPDSNFIAAGYEAKQSGDSWSIIKAAK